MKCIALMRDSVSLHFKILLCSVNGSVYHHQTGGQTIISRRCVKVLLMVQFRVLKEKEKITVYREAVCHIQKYISPLARASEIHSFVSCHCWNGHDIYCMRLSETVAAGKQHLFIIHLKGKVKMDAYTVTDTIIGL